MKWNELGWCSLCVFIMLGLLIIIPLMVVIASPFLAVLFLIDWIGYKVTGYTSQELDRIIAEKHRCSVRGIPYVGI